MDLYLDFDLGLVKQKPNTVRDKNNYCPFCDKEKLLSEGNVIKKEDKIVWIKNKFPVIKESDGFQTVLIEHDECDTNLSNYTKEHLYKLIKFALNEWFEMERSGKYKSVLFMKNFGLFSDASIHHSHMQLIGLKNIDYKENFKEKYIKGFQFFKDEFVECNVSNLPSSEFYEFNVIMDDIKGIHTFADWIQNVTHYILNIFNTSKSSFNITFYHIENKIVAKIIPRVKYTSPYLLGYGIKIVPNTLNDISEEIKQLYNGK